MVTAEAHLQVQTLSQISEEHSLEYSSLSDLLTSLNRGKETWSIGSMQEILSVIQQEYENPQLTLETLVAFLESENRQIDIENFTETSITGGKVLDISGNTVSYGSIFEGKTGYSAPADCPVVYRVGPKLGLPLYEDDWKKKAARDLS